MKNRGKINLIVDLLMLLALALIAGIGFLIKYTLPPGREVVKRYGINTDLVFLGWDRHQWGAFHLLIAYIMLGLLLLHIVLHWKTILCLARSLIPASGLRWTMSGLFGLVVAALFLFAFVLSPTMGEKNDFLHRNSRLKSEAVQQSVVSGPESEPEVGPAEVVADETGVGHDESAHDKANRSGHDHDARGEAALTGRMTLDEAARQYGITTAEAKRRLRIPDQESSQETLGRLRRLYGFTMQQARERLETSR